MGHHAQSAQLVKKCQEKQLVEVLKKWTNVYAEGNKAKAEIQKRNGQAQQQQQSTNVNNNKITTTLMETDMDTDMAISNNTKFKVDIILIKDIRHTIDTLHHRTVINLHHHQVRPEKKDVWIGKPLKVSTNDIGNKQTLNMLSFNCFVSFKSFRF